ncbi:MAG: peptidoglycan-binding domain-containing protein [Planctomycetota bacterium]|nr:peptidoglycan-binding domain-containing protein [Planctomycetota bacterium]
MPSEGTTHRVISGECIASIAVRAGHFPDTVWNHPDNQALRELRADPNVLLVGDEVFVPALREKQESCATEQKHRFRRKGVPSELNVRIEFNGEPRADIPYTLVIDGVSTDGQTDADGWVRAPIPPGARDARLTLRPQGKPPEEIHLQLGHLDPADTVSGQKGRLRNLGYYHGPIDNTRCDEFQSAVRVFQKKMSLPETGRVDAATRDKIKSEHQS